MVKRHNGKIFGKGCRPSARSPEGNSTSYSDGIDTLNPTSKNTEEQNRQLLRKYYQTLLFRDSKPVEFDPKRFYPSDEYSRPIKVPYNGELVQGFLWTVNTKRKKINGKVKYDKSLQVLLEDGSLISILLEKINKRKS